MHFHVTYVGCTASFWFEAILPRSGVGSLSAPRCSQNTDLERRTCPSTLGAVWWASLALGERSERSTLEIIWRNPNKLGLKRVAVVKVVSYYINSFQLRSIYRSVSDAEGAGVLYELLAYPADPVCAA